MACSMNMGLSNNGEGFKKQAYKSYDEIPTEAIAVQSTNAIDEIDIGFFEDDTEMTYSQSNYTNFDIGPHGYQLVNE